MNEQQMIDEFITSKQSHEEQLTLDFARAILDCELQKKEITDDIKVIKQEAKDNGILVQHVMKAVKALKQEIKTDELDKRETQAMLDLLGADSDIRFKIESLLVK
jgi:uncharacterized protein (UPF0335 family)